GLAGRGLQVGDDFRLDAVFLQQLQRAARLGAAGVVVEAGGIAHGDSPADRRGDHACSTGAMQGSGSRVAAARPIPTGGVAMDSVWIDSVPSPAACLTDEA